MDDNAADLIPVVDLRAIEKFGPCFCPHVSGCAPAYHAVWCDHWSKTQQEEEIKNGS